MRRRRAWGLALVPAAAVGAALVHGPWSTNHGPAIRSARLSVLEPVVPRSFRAEVSRSWDRFDQPSPTTTVASTTTTVRAAPVFHVEPRTASAAVSVPAAAPAGGERDLGTFLVTCYALYGSTASGRSAGWGSVAVDPSVIRPGTQLWVAGYGHGTADDTGGAIRGRHIDVWEPTSAACYRWGKRYVDVRSG